MRGQHIYLRAMEVEDMELVRKWNFDPAVARFFNPRVPNSKADQLHWFERLSADKSKVKLIICDIDNHKAIGVFSFMNIDHVNKNCEVGITIGDDNYYGKPHAFDSAMVAFQFLFDQWNMHVIYGIVLGKNIEALNFNKKLGLKETGVMRQMVFKDGRFLDQHILSLTKEEFHNIHNK